MKFTKKDITSINIDRKSWKGMLDHCQRKLNKNYVSGESKDLKAFGLVGGTVNNSNKCLQAGLIIPLLKNARKTPTHKARMDSTMSQHAIPSETPLPDRGWVAEQTELDAALTRFQKQNIRLIGTYHMHRVPWEHDLKRDTPTELDTILGNNSRLVMFIISMVNPDKPVIRAFFEGNIDLEVPVTIP